MNCRFGLVYPLWNLRDEGAALLERVVGQIPLDHLTIPLVTGPLRQFRLAEEFSSPSFRTEGGWHYPAAKSAYATSTVKPRVARWVGKWNGLDTIADFAARHGLKLMLRLDPRRVGGLTDTYSHLRQHNAWREDCPAAGPCVSNADLRQLLRETLDELLAYQPVGFQIVDWAAHHSVEDSAQRPLARLAGARQVTELCFCAACREIALRDAKFEQLGVDTDAVARSARVLFERRIADPTDAERADAPYEDEALAAYVAAIAADTSHWRRQLRERYASQTLLDFTPISTQRGIPARGAGESQADRSGSAQDNAWRPMLGFPRHAAAPPICDESAACCGRSLWIWRPAYRQASELVSALTDLAAAGTPIVDLEGADEAPAEAVEWLRQAVRFARRG